MLDLYAPTSYLEAEPTRRDEVCNGCGSAGPLGFLVPGSIWGLDISEACNIHDWMYQEGVSIACKEEADRVFLNNMVRIIEFNTTCNCSWLRKLRYWRAKKYYYAVREFGGGAFWSGKN